MNTPITKNRLADISRYMIILGIGIALLYSGRPLFIPMSFGLLIAVICYPLAQWLQKKGINGAIAAMSALLLVVLLFSSLIGMLVYEIHLLTVNQPGLTVKLNEFLNVIRGWLDENVGQSDTSRSDVMNKIVVSLENNAGSSISAVLNEASSTLISLILIPLFAFLFLVHRETFVRFIEMTVGEKHKTEIRQIIHESLLSYFSFAKGTFFVYLIVGVLNSIGLLLLGIEHAILFGMLAAFMTIIPYIGILISAALPISIALLTKDSWWYAAGVAFVFAFVQYMEANLIYPRVVGRQLNVSTWAILVAIISGTLIWGFAGMILFVPFAGILKIVSGYIPELKSLNVLLSRKPSA